MFEAGTNGNDEERLIVDEFELTINIGDTTVPKPSVIWKYIFAYAFTTFGDSVVGRAIVVVDDPDAGNVPDIGRVLTLNTLTVKEYGSLKFYL